MHDRRKMVKTTAYSRIKTNLDFNKRTHLDFPDIKMGIT